MLRYVLFFLMLQCLDGALNAQALGVSGLYNLQTESMGVGARLELRSDKRLQWVPQFSYFLPFNKVHEWTLGMSVQYGLVRVNKFNAYGLAHLGYNQWLNYQDSKMKGAQPQNWNGEVGAGVQFGRGFKPFLEWRYNVHFQEAHLQTGILFRVKKGSAKKEKCAAYD